MMEGSKKSNLDHMIECKCCGNSEAAHFEIKDNGYVCKCCGAWNRPKNNSDPKNDMLAYRLLQGYEFLNNYDFERARNSFQRIIKDAPESIDAYWGFLLAKFGVVYVKGFFNGIIEPIYCFPDYDSLGNAKIRSTREFAKILELIGDDKSLRDLYNEHSLKIDRAILNFRKSIDSAENDVFICVKISKATENNPELKGHTEDARLAEKLERDLKARGVNVFYSLHTLTKEIDSDDQIWTHLVKSKKMILIGSQEDYLESVWVKSEWMRWLHLDRQNELYIYVLKHDDESPVSVLPYELRTKQIYTLDSYEKLLKDIVGVNPTAPVQEIEEDKDGKIILFNGREEKIRYGTEEISADAYRDRNDIVRVIIPDGVKRICDGAFANCNRLLEVVLPESLLHIGSDAFYSCDALQKIYIPYRTETIGSQAFYGCGALERITIPSSVKKIGAGVFCYCDTLKGITVDKRNKDYYGNGNCIVDTKQETLIAGCMSTKIPCDDSVIRIGYNSFCGCSNLISIDIPDSVQEIDDGAFMDCRNLRTVAFTSSVARIGDEAFQNCPSLISVKYDAPEAIWDSISFGRGNQMLTKAYKAAFSAPATSDLDEKLKDAEKRLLAAQQQRLQLEKDKSSANQKKEEFSMIAEKNRRLETEFKNRASQAAREKEIAQKNQKNALESKTKAVREMELKAQAESAARAEEAAARARAEKAAREKNAAATEVKEADIRANKAKAEVDLKSRAEAEARAKAASAEKEKDQSLTESNKLTNEIFRIQMDLNTTEALEKNIQLEIEDLRNRIANETKDGKIVYDDGREEILEFGMTEIERAAYSGNETIVKVVLPASLTKIGARAFAGCSNLQSVKMPDTVEVMDIFAFNKCTGLKEINLSTKLTEISNSVFQRCENLTKIVIPDGVTKIGSGAFNKCTKLEDVTVPVTVKFIGTLAFAGCDVDESILPSDDIEIGNKAFDY